MQVKLFNTRIEADQISGDQHLINSFMENVAVKHTAAQFVNGTPDFWSILVFYENGETATVQEATDKHTPEKNEAKLQPREVVKAKQVEPSPQPEYLLSEEEQQILLALKTWRKDKANELQQPEFMIFPNATVQSIAKEKPRDVNALGKIKGVGQAKITRYGDDLIAIINAF